MFSLSTHALEAVAALDGTGVAATGGRKDGESEEGGNSSDASEHDEDGIGRRRRKTGESDVSRC